MGFHTTSFVSVLFVLVFAHVAITQSKAFLLQDVDSSTSSSGRPRSPCQDIEAVRYASCYTFASCTPIPYRCTAAGIRAAEEKRKRDLIRQATNRQKAVARKSRDQLTVKLDGVMLSPGDRGNLGHSRRCAVASDAQVQSLLVDQSDKLWNKAKPLIKAAIKYLLGDSSTESAQIVRDVEIECLNLGTRVARIDFINSVGGEKIDDIFKSTCDISGHLDGVAEDGILSVVGELFKTPAGEYISLLFNKIFKGKWPSSVDYCSFVCRKNKRGVELKRCVIGCAETLEPGCWSQCDLYTCKRGCKNAFWHRKKSRHRCYARCDSKCTLF